MKKLIYILLVFLLACSTGKNEVICQKLVLAKIINDQKLNAFFKNENPVLLEKNKYCVWKSGTVIDIGEKNIKIVSPDSTKHQKTLKLTRYQVSDSVINIEMRLFRENVLLQAKYRKQQANLKELSSNVIFSRKPNFENQEKN